MKKLAITLLCVSMVISAVGQTVYRFHDRSLSDSARIESLLSLMTVDEKINALSTNFGVPRLGIRSTGQSEGLHGMALGGAPGNWGGMKFVNYQTVPDIHYTTIFPQSYGLGATWDVDLIRRVAEIEADEIRYYTQNPRYQKGGMVMRAPNSDLARDPRWGRTEESFGEDPCLAAQLTVAFVRGLQGDNPRYWKSAALMKHFLANSNEDGRDSTSSNFDEQLFYEYYSYPFYKGITEGGAQAFMASYNGWNGIPMAIHPILKTVRQQWGLKGIICTDGGALRLLIDAHHAFPSYEEGLAAIVKNGVGQILDNYREYACRALAEGLLTESDIDNALRSNYYVALRLGLLDAGSAGLPYSGIGVTDTVAPWRKSGVKEFVREVTAKSAVLLKNEGQLLPLDAKKVKKIAVIGTLANEVLMDWYSGTPPYTVSILEGIKNAVGSEVEVIYAPTNELDSAYNIALGADVAIVCIGNHPYGTDARWKYSPVPSDGREAVDRKALSLEQEDLAKIVYKANKHTVLALVSSFPYSINWSQEHLPAIVHVTHCSQELGNGLADVLFGVYNPAGRTTQTWVKSIDDLPPMLDYDIRHGRTYMYSRSEPLYCFGYGLSYTSFAYSGLKTSATKTGKTDSISVWFDVKNTGQRDGEEVVQLYVSFPQSKVQRPAKQLKGFQRVMIKKGESRRIEFKLKASDLAYWDTSAGQWTVESGSVNIQAGASSADIRLIKKINIE